MPSLKKHTYRKKLKQFEYKWKKRDNAAIFRIEWNMIFMKGIKPQIKNVAIVTGSSRGIGAATAKLLALNGYAVCINYINTEEAAEKVVQDIKNDGGEAIAIRADVANESQVIKLFSDVKQQFGPITALINNAGTDGGFTPVEDVTAASLQTVFGTNVFGTFLCSREAVKQMKQNNGGGIINMSSEATKFGGNRMSQYAASKAAINAFTIGFAREVAQYNIRVNTISPGIIDTEIHAKSAPERLQTLKNTVPMGRMGTVNEVAQSILWLLSDQASYLSGAVISVAGGR
jgi:NAD(P)-dependent dehydrogenase (short-subunit alcohol dehydrogenase family)